MGHFADGDASISEYLYTIYGGVTGCGGRRRRPAFRVMAASPEDAVDHGVVLPTVTNEFAGAAPDLGALELGATPPQYGPRQ
jgi:hypothetical protein